MSSAVDHFDDADEGKAEKLHERRRFDRRSTQFELLRGLQVGERHPNRPAAFSGSMQLIQRKMFGKSSRFGVLKDGFLHIYRHKKEVDKGRIWRKIDLAHSVVSYRKADRILLINTDERNELHRFKISKDTFESWVEALRVHRLYRQDQFSGEQVQGEPNTPRSPLTECFPGIPTTRIDVTAWDDVESETSKRRVVEWLLDSEKLDSKERECNEASMLVFELGTLIEELEKCADSVSERLSTVDAESPKEPLASRSLFARLSFRSRNNGRNEMTGSVKSQTTPTLRGKPALQIPASVSTNSVATGSTPDVRKPPRSPSASPVMKRISREESDLFHRDTGLREEYLRLAKEAHKKFRALLRAVNLEQGKLRTLQQKWTDGGYLDKPTDGTAGATSSASSPIRYSDRGLYKNSDRSASMNLRREVLEPTSRKTADKPASIVERPSTDRSSSVYYDAGETPSAATHVSESFSDFGSSYTLSILESENGGDNKEEESLETAESVSSESSAEQDFFADAHDGAKRTAKETTFTIPRYRERLPSYMPTAPSFFKLLYNAIGRDFSRFPLPVSTSEPLGLLQVLCEELEYSDLIDQAVASSDPNMRMVFVAAFAASRYGSTSFRIGRKPFNPLLGETFEFVSPNRGWRYVAEQTSHHPSISACYAEGRGWHWWQSAEANVVFGGRSVEARPVTPVYLHLKKWNETYTWNKVTTYVTGLLSGPPFLIDHHGEMIVHCLENSTKCKIHFEKMHSKNHRGTIAAKVFNPAGKVAHTMFGKWTDSFYLVEESEATSRCIWRLAALPPEHERYYGLTRFAMALNEIKPEVHGRLPPTDSRNRPDQRFLENGLVDDAEKMKRKVESDQRERLKTVREDDVPRVWFRQSNKDPNTSAKWEFTGEYWRSKEDEFKGVDFYRLW